MPYVSNLDMHEQLRPLEAYLEEAMHGHALNALVV
jgi:hypothetical protein